MNTSREILSAVLSGQCTAQQAVEAVRQECLPEDLYLDYKSADLLEQTNTKKRNDELRKDVAAFANADGGMLVIGIEETSDATTSRTLPGEAKHCKDVGGHSPHDWAARTLGDLLPYTGRPPHIDDTARIDGKRVLLVAVDRAPNLVPVTKDGQIRHFLRIGDHTHPVDPYLYADLVLGRRERPFLRFDAEVGVRVGAMHQAGQMFITVVATVENDSLVWVPAMYVSCTGIGSKRIEVPNEHSTERLSDALLRHVEVAEATAPEHVYHQVVRKMALPELSPFERRTYSFRFGVPQPSKPYVWRGVLLANPKNGLPVWSQLHLNVGADGVGSSEHRPLAPGERGEVWWGSLFEYRHARGE